MERVSYKECLRNHAHLAGKRDGCQGFLKQYDYDDDDPRCLVCGCHKNYHRKVIEATSVNRVTQAVYTKCLKIHNYEFSNSADGCQEFMPLAEDALTCAACRCHRSFHLKEMTVKKI